MQLGRRGAGLNIDFLMVRNISSLFMLYCLDPELDNRDTEAKKKINKDTIFKPQGT